MEQIKNKLKGMGLADSTIKTYTSILSNLFEHTKKVNQYTTEEINQYLETAYLSVIVPSERLKAQRRKIKNERVYKKL